MRRDRFAWLLVLPLVAGACAQIFGFEDLSGDGPGGPDGAATDGARADGPLGGDGATGDAISSDGSSDAGCTSTLRAIRRTAVPAATYASAANPAIKVAVHR